MKYQGISAFYVYYWINMEARWSMSNNVNIESWPKEPKLNLIQRFLTSLNWNSFFQSSYIQTKVTRRGNLSYENVDIKPYFTYLGLILVWETGRYSGTVSHITKKSGNRKKNFSSLLWGQTNNISNIWAKKKTAE